MEPPIALLVPFSAYPFRPYDENRLNDLTESIKENRVISPVIPRPLDDGKGENDPFASGEQVPEISLAEKYGLLPM